MLKCTTCYCVSADTKRRNYWNSEKKEWKELWYVYCDCGEETDLYDTEMEAIKRWNGEE